MKNKLSIIVFIGMIGSGISLTYFLIDLIINEKKHSFLLGFFLLIVYLACGLFAPDSSKQNKK